MTVNRFRDGEFAEVNKVGNPLEDASVNVRREDEWQEIWPSVDIPDSVVRHYDATNDSRDTGTKTSIPDQKGNVDLVNGTQVTLVDNGINGLRSYQLDGLDDYLVYDGVSVSTPWTLFAVIQRDSSSRGELFDRGGGGIAQNNGGMTTEDSDRVLARDGGESEFDLDVSNPDLANQTVLIVYEITGSDGRLRVWDPDLDMDSGSGDGTNFGNETVDFFRDRRDQRYLDGYVGEIAISNSDFGSELETFENELLDKWGIN